MAVDPDRHGAVVYQRDFHVSGEFALLNLEAESTALSAEELVQTVRLRRLASFDETRSAALSRVAIERELADDENCAAAIENRSIHLLRLIFEDAKVGHFVGHPRYFFLGISSAHPEQDEKPGADPWALAADDPIHKPELPKDASPARLAAWTAVSRVLFNLDETITKE